MIKHHRIVALAVLLPFAAILLALFSLLWPPGATAPAEEQLTLPPPTVIPTSVTPGVPTQFLVTVHFPSPPPSRVRVQYLHPKGKWKTFGKLRDDGLKGDATRGDGTYTLSRRFRVRSPAGLTVRTFASRDRYTSVVSNPVVVSSGGTITVPPAFTVAPGASVPLMSNAPEPLPLPLGAEPRRGGEQESTVAYIFVNTHSKRPSSSLSEFATEFLARARLRTLSVTPTNVGGRSALETINLGGDPQSVEETRIVFLERDPSSVVTLALEVLTTSPTYAALVNDFNSVVATYRLD